MSPAVARELRILRAQRLGEILDHLSGAYGQRLEDLALEIAQAVAAQRTRKTLEETETA